MRRTSFGSSGPVGGVELPRKVKPRKVSANGGVGATGGPQYVTAVEHAGDGFHPTGGVRAPNERAKVGSRPAPRPTLSSQLDDVLSQPNPKKQRHLDRAFVGDHLAIAPGFGLNKSTSQNFLTAVSDTGHVVHRYNDGRTVVFKPSHLSAALSDLLAQLKKK